MIETEKLSNEELLDIIKAGKPKFSDDDIAIARAELEYRGVESNLSGLVAKVQQGNIFSKYQYRWFILIVIGIISSLLKSLQMPDPQDFLDILLLVSVWLIGLFLFSFIFVGVHYLILRITGNKLTADQFMRTFSIVWILIIVSQFVSMFSRQ